MKIGLITVLLFGFLFLFWNEIIPSEWVLMNMSAETENAVNLLVDALFYTSVGYLLFNIYKFIKWK